jgi:flagellar biosynthesis/type III secretory pathway chaperone
MNQVWGDAVSLLSEIADEYVKMIGLAEEKREALIHVKVAEVNKLIVREESLIKKIGALEKRRIALVNRLAGENGWSQEKIKLLDLVEKAPAEVSASIKEVGQRLADVVMRIALLNGINNNLIKQAMQIIDYNINILSNARALPFYGAGGDQARQEGKGTPGFSTFDRKA